MGLDSAGGGVSGSYPARPDLRFGLVLANKGPGASAETLDAGAETVRRLGWHSVWVTDHLLVPRGPEAAEYGSMLEALTALTYVGARHPGIVLGTSVIVPAMRDAPLLAKQLATLDVLTGGRLVVGVGASDRGDAQEYANLGKSDRFARRGAYLDEAVALWRHLWAGRTEPFTGEFHTLTDFVFEPLPVQGAAIPIWCGGRSERALVRTATIADGYHAAQTGPADLRARIPRLVELTEQRGRPLPLLSVRVRVKFDQGPGSVYTLHGTAQQMVDEVLSFAEVGAEELILVFDATTPEEIVAAVERFHETVILPFRSLMGP